MDIIAIGKIMVVTLALEIILVPVFVYVQRKKSPRGSRLLSPIVFALSIGGAAIIGYVIGVPLGVKIACSMDNAGNLCGLAGYFFFGPLLALIAATLTPIMVWIFSNRVSKPHTLDQDKNP